MNRHILQVSHIASWYCKAPSHSLSVILKISLFYLQIIQLQRLEEQ